MEIILFYQKIRAQLGAKTIPISVRQTTDENLKISIDFNLILFPNFTSSKVVNNVVD